MATLWWLSTTQQLDNSWPLFGPACPGHCYQFGRRNYLLQDRPGSVIPPDPSAWWRHRQYSNYPLVRSLWVLSYAIWFAKRSPNLSAFHGHRATRIGFCVWLRGWHISFHFLRGIAPSASQDTLPTFIRPWARHQLRKIFVRADTGGLFESFDQCPRHLPPHYPRWGSPDISSHL